MAEITAQMVKELREATGLGMMECKKALTESGGDLKKAEELLRIKSGAKASKVAGRVASEGVVATWIADDGSRGAMVEVNCETDFVAKDEGFVGFARDVARVAADTGAGSLAELSEASLPGGGTVEGGRQALVAKLGENMTVRRAVAVKPHGRLAAYVHGTRIGVLVDYSGGDEALGKDLAMHIAASKPVALAVGDVPAELVERERAIARARAEEQGKPANLIDRIAEGAVSKYLGEVTLLGQPFVKDDKSTVEKLLKAKGATVHAFHLYVLGEGIEKKKTDFVAEVMAAAGQS